MSASVMRSTAPPSRKAGHVGSLSGHAARITDLRNLLWSSGAAQPPGGTSRFPPSLRRSTASKGWFLDFLEVPWLAQHNHPYTSPTRGRVSSPKRVRDRAPVPVPWPALLCPPCLPPSLPLRLRRRCRAPPPLCRGHPRRLRPRRGGGWLVPGSWGLGGDELASVKVDVVEVVVVVVVVVVGEVCRHLFDAGGDAPHRLHVRLRGRPALCSLPSSRPPPWAPMPRLACPLGPAAPLPLPLGPFPAPCPCRGSRLPSSTPAPARSPTSPRPVPCTWAPCPCPCAPFPCPGPFPAPCPESRRPLPALCSPPLLRPSWTTRWASRCLCSCGSVTPGGERSRAGGQTCRSYPGGKGLGGNGLGGLVWVWVGLAWARYFALSLPTAADAAAAREASVARAGFFPRLRGVLGVAAWPAKAVAQPAGYAVATPRAPSSFSSATAAAAGEAPVARAGSVPRVRGVLGVAAWPAEAVSRPAGLAAAAPRAPSSLSFAAVAAGDEAPVARAGSAPRFRGLLGVAAWSAEAVVRLAGAAVAIPRAPFLLSSAAAAALGDAPGSCAGAAPRVDDVPGAAVGAAAWLAGAAVSASCASGAPSPPCPTDTWRPHIRRRRPPCPKEGVRTLTIGALRHIRSPLHLQHGPRGSKIEKKSSTDLNTYTTMKYICGDRMKGVYGQSRPKDPRMNALTRLTSTETNTNANMGPSRCYCSHQMDQHVLDIERDVLPP